MLASISGSQGSGKTTILNRLSDLGFKLVARKTSRSILADWGVTLQEVNNDNDLSLKFQAEITKRKFLDEEAAINDDELWFTERTHADLFTYALINLGKNNDFDEWLRDYYETCMRLNQDYELVFYLRAGHFNIEKDGVRNGSPHYSRMIDIAMLDITEQMVHPSKLNVIETPDLEQRLNIIALQSQAVVLGRKNGSQTN